MIPIPNLDTVDTVFGNIDHLPKYKSIPEKFKDHNNPYHKFVSLWFFHGHTEEDASRLVPRAGIDKVAAIKAIKAILVSFAPKHEHKEAGCAFLLCEWFELEGN